MGGIGKTTIAQVIFNKYSSQYEGCCFLKNVKEESQRHGLDYLCEQLVSQLLNKKNHLDKRQLRRKKVFIVLDDVDASEKLDYLIREQIHLGASSRVIVTTRDKQILHAARAHGIYNVRKLSFKSSLELFCLKAFHKSYPENGYEKLSEMAVNYANGIPLALKVLGSFLCSKSAVVWESALKKLKIYPDKNIFDVLKLSYDGLDDFDKSIFLDIAFFFKGKNKDNVIMFLDSCGFYAAVGIDNLKRKALITISYDNAIEMHDLIQQMGWEVVRQESNNDPGKLTRINNPEDFHNLLENSEGKNLVEGIMIDLSRIRDLHLNADTFKNMPHLRFLKLYAPWNQRQSNVHVPAILEPFSTRLRYLEWNAYPLDFLPLRFSAEKLVKFKMPNSQISKLWDGKQDLASLTVLDLYGCKKLVELPDFSKATKLKRIDLGNCEKLCQLHPSILSIETLEDLNLTNCKELKNVKSHLKSLDGLCANNSSNLEEFSVFPSRIKSLPNEVCCFKYMKSLHIRDCRDLTELPQIKALLMLTVLDARGCCSLRCIPELPPSIEQLYADDCTSLETIFSLKAVFSLNRIWISFENCMRLEEESVNDIMEDAHLTIFRNVFLRTADPNLLYSSVGYRYMTGSVYYPGYKVPKWFRFQTEEASITIELDQPYNELLGFIFCCVVSQNLPHYFDERADVNIKCEYRHFGDGVPSKGLNIHKGRLNPGHVLLRSFALLSEGMYSKVDGKHYGCTCKQKISFRFSVDRSEKGKRVQVKEEHDDDYFIKGCGVFPMYASTLVDTIQKLELEFELNPHHNSITDVNLDVLKSAMFRQIRGKSKRLQYNDWW
ncbi:disease resistance protein RPV1-like [Arachis duranensis]|uniref:ADP-ribosyl cyclase/cyclic ADP-ribose hydrolase n=1 Tax=Arachis duranensis TaxID=130453 RepID=A0A9C6TNK0_ARADU|nr:disease resistance protein RPV1-like [Arachis duranensis]